MLHLLPESDPAPRPYAEAVARLASVRHALRLVDPYGGGPASDLEEGDEGVAATWQQVGEARRRCFDRRSERLVGATAAGLEALLAERLRDCEPHQEAAQTLVDEIRRELAEVARAIVG